MAVAVVGYRTYPDANVKGQVDDLELAAAAIVKKRPDLITPPPITTTTSKQKKAASNKWVGLCLAGHSSGAHISLLMLINRVSRALQLHSEGKSLSLIHSKNPIPFDSFIGLSGPYNISHHFDYEANRGVEELSPLKPACGMTRNQFKWNSPAIRLSYILTHYPEYHPPPNVVTMDQLLPKNILLVHGVEDTTVPFTATSDCGRLLRACGASKCEELYLGKTGHDDTVMHFMMGGKTKDAVMEWLWNKDSIRQKNIQLGISASL